MNKRIVLLLTVVCAMMTGMRSGAVPVFAREYHFHCAACHAGFPRLNAFGLAFKANGFRIPGSEKAAILAWQKTVPVAIQIKPTAETFNPGAFEANFTEYQALAGGLLTHTTSFFIHHDVWINTMPLQFPSYEAWVQQVVNERSKIMVKVGQFELPYAYSPMINIPTVFSPLLFGAAPQRNDVRLGSSLRGFQISGAYPRPIRWYVASGAPNTLSPGNTVGAREFIGEFPDVFVRIASNNVERNFGFFTYLTSAPRVDTDPTTKQDAQRYGVDASLLFHRGLQMDAMLVYGQDSNPAGTGKRGFMRGGLIQFDQPLAPWCAVTARYDAATTDGGGGSIFHDAKTFSFRVYISQNVRLQAEYQQIDRGTTASALMADFAF